MSTDLFTLTLYHFDDIMPSREAAGLSSIFMVNIKKESLPFGKLSSICFIRNLPVSGRPKGEQAARRRTPSVP